MSAARETKRPKIVLWLVLLLAVAGAAYYFFVVKTPADVSADAYSVIGVARNTVSVTVTGSGMLESADEVKVEMPEGLKIDSIVAHEGDLVAEGDTLYTVDAQSVADRIAAVRDELSSYSRTVMRVSSFDSVYCPSSGRIKALYVHDGDSVEDVMAEYGCLALLTADDKMFVTLAGDLKPGETLTAMVNGKRQTATVEKKTAAGYEITLPAQHANIGDTVEIYRGKTLLGSGKAEVHEPICAYGTSGTVKEVQAKLNASVNVSTRLLALAGKEDKDSYRTAVTDRREAAEELQKLYVLERTLAVTAPEQGTVASLALAEKAVSQKDAAAAVLHTGGAVKMTVEIDETDIAQVKPGCPVSLTLDAYESETFSGTVERVSRIGKVSGSITVYETVLVLDPDERLLEGMHGSAVITVDEKTDVLTVPVSALQEDKTGTFVYVQTAGEPEVRYVTTGLSNGTDAEIVSGLSEGEQVLYTENGGIDIMAVFNRRRAAVMGK